MVVIMRRRRRVRCHAVAAVLLRTIRRLGMRIVGPVMRPGPVVCLRLLARPPAPAAPTAAPAAFLLADLLALLGRRACRRLFGLLDLLLVVLLDRRRKLHHGGRNHRRFLRGEVAQPLETEGGRDERVVMRDGDAEAIAYFDLRQGLPLLMEAVQRPCGRYVGADLRRAAADAFLLYCAQDMQRRRFGRADMAGAGAMGAGLGRRLDQRRSQPLARQFEQAERADATELDACAVVFHAFLETALDRALVAVLLHVDEIDDDEAGEVAQTELAGDLLRRLEVGAQRRLLDVALLGRASRIDVDRDQRFRRVDDDVAARA